MTVTIASEPPRQPEVLRLLELSLLSYAASINRGYGRIL